MGAIQRLMAPDDVRIVVSGLALDPDAAVDGGVGDLWVEVDLPGVPKQAAAALRDAVTSRRRRRSISASLRASRCSARARASVHQGGGRGGRRRRQRRGGRLLPPEDARRARPREGGGDGRARPRRPRARRPRRRRRRRRAARRRRAPARAHRVGLRLRAARHARPAGFGRNDALKIGVGQLALNDALRRTTTGSSSVEVDMKKACRRSSRCRRRPRAAECPKRSSSSSRRWRWGRQAAEARCGARGEGGGRR